MGRPLPEVLLVDTQPDNTPPVPGTWALPESGSDDRPGPVAAAANTEPSRVGGADDWREPEVVSGPPRLPVPLKPMTTSDILDGAWAITKARPRTVIVLTAVIILPPQLLTAFLLRGIPQGLDTAFSLLNPDMLSTRQSATSSLNQFVAYYVAAAIVALSYYFLGAALGRLVAAWYGGGDLTVKEVLVATARKSGVVIATFLLLLVPIVASTVACYVGAVFVIPLFMLAGPIIGIEDAGPITAAKRSWQLVSRRLFWCIWYWFATFLIEALVNTAIQAAPEIIGLVSEGAARFLVPIASVVAHCVTAPFVVGVAVLVYLDLRVRTEALDLELEAGDVFARAA